MYLSGQIESGWNRIHYFWFTKDRFVPKDLELFIVFCSQTSDMYSLAYFYYYYYYYYYYLKIFENGNPSGHIGT